VSVSCKRCVLSGGDLSDWPIARPEEFHLVWCVIECDQAEQCLHLQSAGRRSRTRKKKNIKKKK